MVRWNVQVGLPWALQARRLRQGLLIALLGLPSASLVAKQVRHVHVCAGREACPPMFVHD